MTLQNTEEVSCHKYRDKYFKFLSRLLQSTHNLQINAKQIVTVLSQSFSICCIPAYTPFGLSVMYHLQPCDCCTVYTYLHIFSHIFTSRKKSLLGLQDRQLRKSQAGTLQKHYNMMCRITLTGMKRFDWTSPFTVQWQVI